jgi:hypothetical protein
MRQLVTNVDGERHGALPLRSTLGLGATRGCGVRVV